MRTHSIVGTWSLVSMVARSVNGDEFYPYGENPDGLIIYTPAGDVAVLIMHPDRPNFASGDLYRGSAEEIKEAFEGFDAYGGTYELDLENGVVTHHLQVARFPNWVGSDQVRYFELQGDRLLLSTPPIPSQDQEWVIEVVWQRKS